MKKIDPLLEKAIQLATTVAINLTVKAIQEHKKNANLKRNNIYVLSPKHFTPVN